MLFGLFQSKTKNPKSKAGLNLSKSRQKSPIFKTYKSPSDKPSSTTRVFAAKKPISNPEVADQKQVQKQIFKNNFNFQSIKFDSTFKSIRYFFFKYQISTKINSFLAKLVIFILIFAILYLTFFDTFFLVKKYTFSFAPDSYLSEKELTEVSGSIRKNYFLGFVPNNQYWFLNQRNLTESAKQAVPEIYAVKIKDRNWPDGVHLEIQTEPILLTLAVNESSGRKYWRISQEGRVVTEDLDNLREKLVRVEQRVDFNQSGVTLQDYKLEQDTVQINRFWFVIQVWKMLDELKIPIRSTTLPTMTDTEVRIETTTGTKLLFESDTSIIPREYMENRILTILKSTIRDRQDKGEVAYIDFRIPSKRVFVCYKTTACDK